MKADRSSGEGVVEGATKRGVVRIVGIVAVVGASSNCNLNTDYSMKIIG